MWREFIALIGEAVAGRRWWSLRSRQARFRSYAPHASRPIVNSFRNNASDSRRPSSVNTTDLALPTGSEINPFVWSRSIAAQSKDFQARIPS